MAETVTTEVGAASKTAFGTVKIGDNIDVANGVISVSPSASYTLPVATRATLGGVKQGANVAIADDGTLSVKAPVSDTHINDLINAVLKDVLATGTLNSDGTLTFTIEEVPR